jgi:hypothetical protein
MPSASATTLIASSAWPDARKASAARARRQVHAFSKLGDAIGQDATRDERPATQHPGVGDRDHRAVLQREGLHGGREFLHDLGLATDVAQFGGRPKGLQQARRVAEIAGEREGLIHLPDGLIQMAEQG